MLCDFSCLSFSAFFFPQEIQKHKVITSDFEIITSYTLRKFEGKPLNSVFNDVAPWGNAVGMAALPYP